MRLLLIVMLSSIPLFGAKAEEQASQSIVDLAGQLDEPLTARFATGEVRSVDYSKRQAIIGGYLYDFGPPGLPIQIQLLGGGSGAFELLQPGQAFRITYGELGTARIAVVLEELSPSEFEDH